MLRVVRLTLAIAAFLALLPVAASAQEGQMAGTVRDSSGAVMPGVLVEVTSPALIEKVRASNTDGTGQYRITNLPVGTYRVTFTLSGFRPQQRDSIVITTGFTAPVNAVLQVGQVSEVIQVVAETPTVDVQSARQVSTFDGEEIRALPVSRQVRSLLTLNPALTVSGLGADCVGGAGVWCNNNIYNLGAHAEVDNGTLFAPDNLAQDALASGRIMVDGTVINAGSGSIMGLTGGYTPDIANAQEVNIQISGALGESETGGVMLNIVPRTGGNRYAGTYYTSWTRNGMFATNNGTHTSVEVVNATIEDHRFDGSFGGPIRRDRLWFHSAGHLWGKEAFPGGWSLWPNLHSGKWGANYQPDRSKPVLTFTNQTRNINVRLTYQATQKNKFNIFWDEQDTCQDPCNGSVSASSTPDSTWSGQVRPSRLRQVSWTNPYTNTILLEGGLSANTQRYDFSHHRYATVNQGIPRVNEFGTTSGLDDVAPRVNAVAGGFFGLTSGPLNSAINGLAEYRDNDDFRTRASLAYVTGTHNMKVGYEGAYYSSIRHNNANDLRLEYRYDTPAASCAATLSCGNTSLYFPNDPFNLARRPVPSRVTINTGEGVVGSRVLYNAFYAQDQWTVRRFTLSGGVRYDHAWSRYLETCIGPDRFVPLQSNGQNVYCTPPSDGVSYDDITPRWGVSWDLFGTGRTAIKWNMGKYLQAASIGGIYAGANPAVRTVNSFERTWNDVNGDRIVNCDLLNFAPNGECGGPAFTFPAQDPVRYGRDPLGLDAAGIPIGLATTQCGRKEQGIPADVQRYCDAYGDTLLEGWGKRRYEWQFGLGIQHELLPRLSAEVTYNRRSYGNIMVSDVLGIGCDRFLGAQDVRTCQEGYLNYTSPQYDFFSVQAPSDPRLPGGGGYTIRGVANPSASLPFGRPTAQTLMPELEYFWHGVDTNFIWRAPGGLRLQGGTSTGRSVRDTCFAELDGPSVKSREGNDYRGGCRPRDDFRTNVRASATYTIPVVDVLASTIVQWRPGNRRTATVTFGKDQVTWEPSSAARATQPCAFPNVGQVGCFVPGGVTVTATTYQVNLLDPGDIYGEGYTLVDLKLAKNFRFGNRRINVGVDVYNLLNNDAILDYDDTYTIGGVNTWNTPEGLLSPRFARIQIQLDF